jgi:hypothetical protein
LQDKDRRIPKIHNLIELMILCEEVDGSCEILRADLVTMERFSVRTRYPGETAEKGDARSAYAAAGTARKFGRQKLGIK